MSNLIVSNIVVENSMTVADLKKLLAGWPETDENGDPCEVWVCGSNGLSNQVKRAVTLNLRTWDHGKLKSADLLLEHDG